MADTVAKQLLWGDTHVHSSFSADSYLYGNFTAGPDTAYRYARGEPVIHPYHRARIQIGTPLDFLVVADHAEFLGGMRIVHTQGFDTEGMGFTDRVITWLAEKALRLILRDGYGMDVFKPMGPKAGDPREVARKSYEEGTPSLPGQERIIASAWTEQATLADANNEPGKFTALIGWEWTSNTGGANLHRVVFTDGDAASASNYLPFSSDGSPYPEDLWRWLARTSEQTGADFIAIPHNSNISKGYMFPVETLRGAAFTPEYLALRSAWEPVVEATQIKGDSETHPQLSPDDPFADFERYGFYIETEPTPYRPQAGDYVRSALLRGLQIEREQGINPYRFGMIGSTDSHTGIASAEEDNFHGKLTPDSIPRNKRTRFDGDGHASGWDMSASGLAAVWAEENSREAIVAAFRRREVYATTGPRITVRFDGGWVADSAGSEVPRSGDSDTAWNSEYPIPMGGVLPPAPGPGAVPGFHVMAMQDPAGSALDRIQIVKGWIDAGGNTAERVFDVAWSQPRELTPDGSPRPVPDSVGPATATIDSRAGGAPQLAAEWHDPSFDPGQHAFDHVRVLQIPTPRHSLLDAVALGEDAAEWPASLQERAYTSPIWYTQINGVRVVDSSLLDTPQTFCLHPCQREPLAAPYWLRPDP
ncbi:MAG: DUF3604 domain-containing protein [Halioglobus sp.]|nr:DUF3604 domain-containing protein [Halioglobus sp.]